VTLLKNLKQMKRMKVLKSSIKYFLILMLLPVMLQAEYPRRSVKLHRVTSGFLPADGLLSLDLALGRYNISYGPDQVSFSESRLRFEYSAFSWLHLFGQARNKSWSGGSGSIPVTGSGIGDNDVGVVLGLPTFGKWQGISLSASSTIPTGDQELGLSEGEPVKQVELTLSHRLWRKSQLPEMTLHLSAGRRWNVADGFGGHSAGKFQFWYPLYPAGKDFTLLAAAVEFRRDNVDLFVEYSEAQLDGISRTEWQKCVSTGLYWGDHTGWGMSMTYDVPLGRNLIETDFEADYPDLITTISISRVFGIGGRDRDSDGILDRLDWCPKSAEDFDGWQDDDGCPDPDNDNDGVLDINDLAPDSPEDIDNWQDEDGIPDPDNDGDGFLDVNDPCPDEAEDMDGYRDDDGCPEEFPDIDGDGIADEKDNCPEQAEDMDGYEDSDGCPELDNDLDGILDTDDDCPNSPEDYDGDSDSDGCPE